MTDEEFAALNITMRRPGPYGVGWIGASDPAMLPAEPPALDLSAFAERTEAGASGFLTANWPADTPLPPSIWSNCVRPMPTPTVEDLLALKARLTPPAPEQLIITPSLAALEAVVGDVQLAPDGGRTLTGIRVVVTKHASHPQLMPAAVLAERFVDAACSFLDQLDAIADSPEPLDDDEGPPDGTPEA